MADKCREKETRKERKKRKKTKNLPYIPYHVLIVTFAHAGLYPNNPWHSYPNTSITTHMSPQFQYLCSNMGRQFSPPRPAGHNTNKFTSYYIELFVGPHFQIQMNYLAVEVFKTIKLPFRIGAVICVVTIVCVSVYTLYFTLSFSLYFCFVIFFYVSLFILFFFSFYFPSRMLLGGFYSL